MQNINHQIFHQKNWACYQFHCQSNARLVANLIGVFFFWIIPAFHA